MTSKPLPPHKAKQLLDTLRRSMKNLEVYEVEGLPVQQQKELLKRASMWILRKPLR
jgi:hypothetical protein